MTKILIAEDDTQMQIALQASLGKSGYEITMVANGKSALEAIENDSFDLIISDQRMPELGGLELLNILQEKGSQIPFIMITAYGTINQAVEAMQKGASDFITKPFSVDDLVRVVERVVQNGSEIVSNKSKKPSLKRPIITNDPLMIKVLEIAEAVARSDATVLIQGESGTGKELIARMVHASSVRRSQAFVAVNCAALPDTLLESELFGHEKGAFTGAQVRKIGKFELAHGGTILLDEISEMELPLQAKLLRVLQEREVDRVGGKEPISIDVRVLATTNRSLEQMVKEGKFRADLYYRLNVIPLTVPALRQRKKDIRLLAEYFMKKNLGNSAPVLSEEVLVSLENYSWPGNIRELQNSVERAAILAMGNSPKREDFLLSSGMSSSVEVEIPSSFQAIPVVARSEGVEQDSASMPTASGVVLQAGMTVEAAERELILQTLKSTNFNRTKAAELLGISSRTLRNKLHEYREAGVEGLEGLSGD